MIIELTGENFDNMTHLAQDVLLDYGFYNFPVDVFELARKIGMNLIPYSTLSPQKLEKLLAIPGTDKGLTIAIIRGNKLYYDTYYNDIDFIEAAQRFTIAHEIKHVVSGDCFKETAELNEKDEILADNFAKCLLAPQSVIIKEKLRTPNQYAERFGLSYAASTIWWTAVSKRKCRYGESYLLDFEKEFLKELQKRQTQYVI
ncbi:MAG: ImmA/IrrE family metallo-endopeptidase [Corallococcus sp.]|nr:ImmA/IrrE family metallo-endopeptidase [Corallococcus sp.]